MAVNLGVGYVSVVPSARGFVTSLRRQIGNVTIPVGVTVNASRVSSSLASQIGNQTALGRRMGDSAGEGFADRILLAARRASTLVAGIFAANKIIDAGTLAFRVAADFEQQEVAFQGILGNVELAQQKLAELQAFARSTPFDFPTLVDAGKKLLAFGFSAERIIPIMGILGDAASTLGESDDSINRVVRALGQIGSKGRVQLEELNQIAEAFPGTNPVQALADAMGKSTQDFTKALSEPGGALQEFGLTGQQAVEILLDSFTKLPGAAGAMERQSRTLKGTLSNLRDVLRQTAIESLKPFLPGISEAIRTRIIPALDALGRKMPEIIRGLVNAVSTVGGALLRPFTEFVQGIQDTEAPTKSAFARLGQYAGQFAADVRTAFGGFQQGLDGQVSATETTTSRIGVIFSSVIDSMRTELQTVKEFFSALVIGPVISDEAATQTETNAFRIREAIAGGLEAVRTALEKVQPHVDKLLDTIAKPENKGAIDAAAAALLAFGSALGALHAFSLASTIAGAMASLGASLAGLLIPLGTTGLLIAGIAALIAGVIVLYFKFQPFRDLVDSVVDALVRFWGAVREVDRAIWGGLKRAFEWYMDVTGKMDDAIVGGLVSAFRATVSAIDTAVESVSNFVRTVAGSVVPTFKAIGSALGTAFGTAGGAIKEAFEDVKGALQPVITFVEGVLDKIRWALQDFATWVNDNYGSTIRAAIDLVITIFGLFRDAIVEVGKFVADFVKWLDVSSYLEDFAQAWKELVEGFTEIWNIVKHFFPDLGGLFRWLGEQVVAFAEWLGGFATRALGLFVGTLKFLYDILAPIVTPILAFAAAIAKIQFKNVQAAIEGFLGVLRGFIKIVDGLLSGDWSKVWEGFKDIFFGVFAVVERVAKSIVEVALAVLTFFVDFADGVVNAILDLIKFIWDALVEGFWLGVNELAGIVEAVIQWIVDTAKAMSAETWRMVAAIADWVWEGIKQIGFALAVVATVIGTWIADAAVWIAEQAWGLLTAMFGWIGDAAVWVAEHLVDVWITLTDWLVNTAAALPGQVAGVAAAMWGWIAGAPAAITGWLGDVWTAIWNWVTGLPDQLAGAFDGMWDGMVGAFVGAINAIIDAWNGLDFTIGGGSYDPLGNLGPTVTVPAFTFNTPDIPRIGWGGTRLGPATVMPLATGGVFDQEFMGLLRLAETPTARPEIVTPQRLMAETFRAELAAVGAGRGGGVTIENVNVENPVNATADEVVAAIGAKLGWRLTTRNER